MTMELTARTPAGADLVALAEWLADHFASRVASGRLARGDASVAIGVNMHLVAVMALVRRREVAHAAGNARRERAFAESIAAIAREQPVIPAAMSEPAQDLTRPSTRAVRSDRGWRIDGRKIFCTMSP